MKLLAIDTANMRRVNEGAAVSVEHAGVPYCVVRDRAALRAFIRICPHDWVAFQKPDYADGCIVCPIHDVTFDAGSGHPVDRKGKNVAEGLRPVEIVEESGQFHILVDDSHRQYVQLCAARRRLRIEQKRLKRESKTRRGKSLWARIFGW